MGFLQSLLGRFFGPPGKDEFARIMADAVRRAGEKTPHTYDGENFRLIYIENGKQKRVVNLGNLYLEYCTAPRRDRKEWLLRTCRAMVNPMAIPDEFEDARPDLLPTVRPRAIVETMRLRTALEGGEPAEMAALPLSEHLVVCLVYDLPSAMQFVMADQIERWGVTLYEALEVARHNLEERAFTLLTLGESLYVFQTGDSYDATRLLLKDAIRQLTLAGRPVAMAVNRNTLLVSGTDDDAGVGMMADLAEKGADDARPLCPIPVVLEGDEWETWEAPPDHPHRDRLRMLEVTFLGGEYTEHKELLERRNERDGEDVFVASYSAVERDGIVRTWAIWSKGVTTSLPKTEYVALFDPETKWTRFAPWDDLLRVVGKRMEAEDCYPPRWLVTDFPTPEQIEQMKLEDWSKQQ